MLVEKAMFLHCYDYSDYTAFIKYPRPNFKIPENYTYEIAGRIKNKIAQSKVKPRAQYALESVLGIDQTKTIMDTLDKTEVVEIPEDISLSEIKNF